MDMNAWSERVERKLTQLLLYLSSDPEGVISKNRIRGLRHLSEQNPVALYLTRKLDLACDAGTMPGSEVAFAWVSEGPRRDVIGASELPARVADFLTDFDRGMYPQLERGATPQVTTPWGANRGIYPIDVTGLWWIRGDLDEGLVASQWCLFASSQAARACGQVAGTFRCWGHDAWPIALAEVPDNLVCAVLQKAPVEQDYSQGTDRMIATYLNSCSLGRQYMKAVGHKWLWPADAIVQFDPPEEGGTVVCRTCSGGQAKITQLSLIDCVKRQVWPVTLEDCERVSGPSEADDAWMARLG